MAAFLEKLCWVVPIQIVRAEHNQFKPMLGGLSTHLATGGSAVRISSQINFGMYEYILNSWKANVKTITSMGRQSTGIVHYNYPYSFVLGKSTMMNQLFGSLFNVSGARCTDGVWMTMRVYSDTLYILLDFEGFGTIYRQPQVYKKFILLHFSKDFAGRHLLGGI